jgi:hypothetical protein
MLNFIKNNLLCEPGCSMRTTKGTEMTKLRVAFMLATRLKMTELGQSWQAAVTCTKNKHKGTGAGRFCQ